MSAPEPTAPAAVPRWHAARVMGGAAGGLTSTMLPMFLLTALSVEINRDLDLAPEVIGLAATGFFGSTALGAVPLGYLAGRMSTVTTLRIGLVSSAATCIGLATVASRAWHVVALLILAGWGMAFVEVAAAQALTGSVGARRQGLAFGVKQASVPVASMLAGLSLPMLVLRFGWRPAFLVGALAAPVTWLVMPRLAASRGARAARRDGRVEQRPALVLISIGVCCGAIGAIAGAAFLVPAAISVGWAPGPAGLLLSLGSVASILVRLTAGWAADRVDVAPARLLVTALLLGAGGAALLATATAPVAMVVGAILVLGAGWGWTGLAFLTVVRLSPGAPAAAAGIMLSGMTSGSAIGPLLFSAVVVRTSYPFGWGVAAVALTLAGVLVASGQLVATRGAASGGQTARRAASGDQTARGAVSGDQTARAPRRRVRSRPRHPSARSERPARGPRAR